MQKYTCVKLNSPNLWYLYASKVLLAIFYVHTDLSPGADPARSTKRFWKTNKRRQMEKLKPEVQGGVKVSPCA